MRRLKRLIPSAVLLSLLLTLSGCWTLSINPFYTEKDIVPHRSGLWGQAPRLTGIWGDPSGEDQETWQFIESKEDESYRLIVREDERNLLINPETDGVFTVHVFKLDGHLFMDLYPEEPEGVNDMYKSHVIPAHSFSRIKIEAQTLSISYFDSEWLREAIENGDLDIRHEHRDGLIVLTASTAELQAMVREHLDEAFDEPHTAQRLQ